MSEIDDRVRRRARSAQRKTPEADAQKGLVALLRLHRVPVFHCPNESMVPVQYRVKLRALGLSSGVPDLVIVQPPWALLRASVMSPTGYPFVGAVLEMKSERGDATPEQLEWLAHFAAIGFATAVARGYEAGLAQLRAWGYVP